MLAASLTASLTLSRSARADCAPTPAACFCETAEAVVDGHVESAGATLAVRIDAISRRTPASLPQLVVGELISVDPIYSSTFGTGDRVLFAVDQNAQLSEIVFAVSAADTVKCEMSGNHEASIAEATDWLLADRSDCHAALEARGWMSPCDDTVESCSASAERAPAASNWHGALALSVLLVSALRRRRSA